MFKKILVVLSLTAAAAGTAFAAHPLITDDTGTQGKGRFQLEINSELSRESEDGATEDSFEVASVLSYGVADMVDVVLGVPYRNDRFREPGSRQDESGLSDLSVELKWRIYDKDGFSLALKPGITLPTGDDERGLGAGKATYSALFIASKEIEPWAIHMNLGYIRNENKADERRNLWHASLAATVEAIKDLTLVVNMGIERNTDRNVRTHPAFVLGGVICSLSENVDLDAGIKAGINQPETDYAVLAGLAWRF